MANFQLWLYSPQNVRRKIINDFYFLSYTGAVSDIGAMTVRVPVKRYSRTLFPDLAIMEIWRTPNGLKTKVELNRPYLEFRKRWFKYGQVESIEESGVRLLEVKFKCNNFLLETEPVIAYAGSSRASKEQPADNMAKEIVRENLGVNANDFNPDLINRIRPNLTVQPNLSQCPTIKKEFAWGVVLNTLKEIAASSDLEGKYMGFGLVWDGANYDFRTRPDKWGTDRRMNGGQKPDLFSSELGNLAGISLEKDNSGRANVVVGLGQGQGENRQIISAYDPTRVNTSPYSRYAKTRDARQSNSATSVTDEAVAALRDSREKEVLRCTIVETKKRRYGINWGLGDYLTVVAPDGRWINMRADIVSNTVQQGENLVVQMVLNIGDYLTENYVPPTPDPPIELLCNAPGGGSIFSIVEGVTYTYFEDGARLLNSWRGDLAHTLNANNSGSSAFGINFTEPYGRDFWVNTMTVNLSYSTAQSGANYWEVFTSNEIANQIAVGVGHTQANPATLSETTYSFTLGNINHLRFTPVGSPGTLTVTATVDYKRLKVCQYDT